MSKCDNVWHLCDNGENGDIFGHSNIFWVKFLCFIICVVCWGGLKTNQSGTSIHSEFLTWATTNFDSSISSDPKNRLFQMLCVSPDVIDLEKICVWMFWERGGWIRGTHVCLLSPRTSPVANACEHETCLTNAPFPFYLCWHTFTQRVFAFFWRLIKIQDVDQS